MHVKGLIFALLFPLTITQAVISEEHHSHELSHHEQSDSESRIPPGLGVSHHHNSHVKPLEFLNETQILLTHNPDPPAYWQLESHREVLVAHVMFMTLSFFVFLPLAIFLKAGGSAFALLPQAAFLLSAIFGGLFGTIYKASTPDLYEGNAHAPIGWIVLFLVVILNAMDVLSFFTKTYYWFKSKRNSPVGEEENALLRRPSEDSYTLSPTYSRQSHEEVNWDQVQFHHLSTTVAESTVCDNPETPETPVSTGKKVFDTACVSIQYSLVMFGWVQLCTGIAVFSGSCREYYGNGCYAHIIKGSIFLWYGLLSFARYVGAFSTLGWAWNRRPDSGKNNKWIPTAEFVECAVCCFYGLTNTWLERLGKSGAYSVKDMQHISIAVMFWFAGGLGMLLESRTIRSWLAHTAVAASGKQKDKLTQPPTALFSFNPFPALIIGVTGIAMAAHHQTYVFQVQIHSLWGLLLASFSGLRLMTYFFLYLRPPASVLPGRPPTEALASFCLCAGGVVFILSDEEVSFAAMRYGWDDAMAFLNATVALVSIWFSWVLVLFAIKGWAARRSHQTLNPSRIETDDLAESKA